MPTSKIHPNPENPRTISEDKFAQLVRSLREFPEMLQARPIVVNPDHVVLGGNMRLKACIEAGIESVPVYVASWDEAKQREFVVKDNVSYGEWDWDTLANEWEASALNEWGLDVWDPENEKPSENQYSTKVETPEYKPTREKPLPEELVGITKYRKLLEKIEASTVPPEVAEFLRLAAARHLVFDYELIAEYYAHAHAEVQILMEDSALVIIDFDHAIRDGFVRMHDKLQQQYLEEHG